MIWVLCGEVYAGCIAFSWNTFIFQRHHHRIIQAAAWEKCDGNKPRSIKTKNMFIVEASYTLVTYSAIQTTRHQPINITIKFTINRRAGSGHHLIRSPCPYDSTTNGNPCENTQVGDRKRICRNRRRLRWWSEAGTFIILMADILFPSYKITVVIVFFDPYRCRFSMNKDEPVRSMNLIVVAQQFN